MVAFRGEAKNGSARECARRGWGGGGFQGQVDFRYVGDNALLMTLDGGIRTESTFSTIDDIIERGYRIHDLDQRSPGPLPPPAP